MIYYIIIYYYIILNKIKSFGDITWIGRGWWVSFWSNHTHSHNENRFCRIVIGTYFWVIDNSVFLRSPIVLLLADTWRIHRGILCRGPRLGYWSSCLWSFGIYQPSTWASCYPARAEHPWDSTSQHNRCSPYHPYRPARPPCGCLSRRILLFQSGSSPICTGCACHWASRTSWRARSRG